MSSDEKIATSKRLRELLTSPKYSHIWQAKVRRRGKNGREIHTLAVARVLTEYYSLQIAQDTANALRRLKNFDDQANRMLYKSTFGPKTLELFIAAFGIDTTDAMELWELMDEKPLVGQRNIWPYRILSAHDIYTVGPNGRPTKCETTELWYAEEQIVYGCRLIFDNAIAKCEVKDGVALFDETTKSAWLSLNGAIPQGATRKVQYTTLFAHTATTVQEFVRTTTSHISDVTVTVQFSRAKIPQQLAEVTYNNTFSLTNRCNLSDTLAATRHADALENCSMGFRWAF